MTVQIVDLEVAQMGIESSAGTLVAATHVVDMLSGTLKFDRKFASVMRAGSLATRHRALPTLIDYELEIKCVGTYDRLFTMLPYFMAPTITGSGASADKTAVFTPSDSADNLKTASFEVGGADTWPQEFQLAGCKGKSFEIDIDQQGLWQITWTFQGQKLTIGAKTGSLSPAVLTDILGFSTKPYIDTSTIHSTQPGRLLSAKYKYELGTSPRHYLGSTTGEAGAVAQTKRRNVTLDMSGEWATTTEYLAWAAGTERKISLDSVGPALGDTAYEARIDFYGKWDTWEMGEADGGITEETSATAIYDTGASTDTKITVVSSLAAIP